MKYFKAKTSDSTSKSSKRRPAAEAGALAGDDQPQCSTAGHSKRTQEKAKDPYRRQRAPLFARSPKTKMAAPQLPPDAVPAAGDVQAAARPSMSPSKHYKVADADPVSPVASAEAVVAMVSKEQQTSDTGINMEYPELEEYNDDAEPGPSSRPQHREDLDDEEDVSDSEDSTADAFAGTAPTPATASSSVPETELSARLSTELATLASLVDISAGTPASGSSSGARSLVPPDPEADTEGIRGWQRVLMGRLTRARQRRDIRLNRKEVFGLQQVLDSVLKQFMSLSREVEAVKANLQWETLEPVSLSRALSRLQSQRREEAAALNKILVCKDKEVQNLQALVDTHRASVHTLQQQVATLEQSCTEKDADLEKAATTLATFHAMHRKTVQEKDRYHTEELVEIKKSFQQKVETVRAASEKAVAEIHNRLQAAELSHQKALKQLCHDHETKTASLQAAFEKREAELSAELSCAKTDAAAKESDYEMESLRLSRALTEKEAHLDRLMAKVEQLHAERVQEAKTLRQDLRDAERSARVAKAEAAGLRADAEAAKLVMSKALSERDQDTTLLRETINDMRNECESNQQALRQASDLLRQRDVESLDYRKTINEKDLQISNLMIEAQNLHTAQHDAEARLQMALVAQARAEDAHGRLLKTVEAMNARQEDLTRQLHHAFGQLDVVSTERAHFAAEANELRVTLEALRNSTAVDAETVRKAKQDAKSSADEADRLRKALEDLQQGSAAELNALRQKVKDLQRGAAEAEALRAALKDLQDSRNEEVEGLKQALRERAHEVQCQRKELDEAAAKRQLEAEHFRKALHEKDVQMRDLKDQFVNFRMKEEQVRTDLEARCESLVADTDEREKEIAVLKNSVNQMKMSHRERMATARADLERKQAELAELDKAVKKHKQSADQARADLRELQQSGHQAEAALGKLRQSGQEKDERINELVRECGMLQHERDALRLTAEHAAKQHDNYQTVIEEKDGEVRALRDRLDRLQARGEADRAEAEAAARRASQAAEDADRVRAELNVAVEQREAQVVKFSRLLKVVRGSFQRRASEREALQLALEEARAAAALAKGQLDSALLSHQSEQDKVMKMMLGKDNDMKQLRENLHQYEDHLRSTKDEMDATIALLKRKIVDLERDAHRRDAELRRKDAELEKLKSLQAEVMRLQLSEQSALDRCAELENSLQCSKRTVSELELEVEIGRSVLKKNAEEFRLKTEKLQQNLENVHQEKEAEMTVLKDSIARLEVQVCEREREMQVLKDQHAVQVSDLQQGLHGHFDEAERLSEEASRLQWSNEQLLAERDDLHHTIECLQDLLAKAATDKEAEIAAFKEQTGSEVDADVQRRVAEAVAAKDVEIAKLQEQIHRLAMQDTDGDVQRRVADALQEQLAALRAEAVAAQNAALHKDEIIAKLKDSVETLRSGLDLDVLKLRSQLEETENERLQLSARASALESRLLEQTSLLAKQVLAKDAEIRELTEAKASVQAKYEKENHDLAEEHEQLLSMLQRMQREHDADAQDAVKTTHDALVAREQQLQRLSEEAAEAEALRQRLEATEAELARLREQGEHRFRQQQELEAARAEALDAEAVKQRALSNAELKLRQEVRSLKDKAETDERALRSRDTEVDKLKQTIAALRTDLALQKQFLLTLHEGQADLATLSDHDALAKTARAFQNLKNTEEMTALLQDGDHQPAARPPRRPLFELKRTWSEGDHLGVDDHSFHSFDCDKLFDDVLTPSVLNMSEGTATDLTAAPAADRAPPPPPPPPSSLLS